MMMKGMKSPDLGGFVKSLKQDFRGAIYDVIIRYVLSNFAKMVQGPRDLPLWVDMFKDILREGRFLLIVLDAARLDAFKQLYPRYLRGSLHAVRVPPPNTYGWLPPTFSVPEFDHIRVFYARLDVDTHDIRLRDFVPRGRDIEIYDVGPRKLRWLKTVTPHEINEVVRSVGLSGRDIVWYAQPHFPWVCDPKLSLALMHEVRVHDFLPPDTVSRALKNLGICRERVVKAYYCNLDVALRGVRDLLSYVRNSGMMYDRIVVTSDHGELLGEYGLFLHQEYDLPQLTVVPWLEVKL